MSEVASTPSIRPRIEELRRAGWLVRLQSSAPRYLLALAAVVLSAAGLRSMVAPAPATQIPQETLARLDPAMESFALRFARVYLSVDPARADVYDARLEAFVPGGMDAQAGRVPPGMARRVLWAEVAQNQEALAGGRVVVVEAKLTGEPRPVYLAVRVMRTEGELQLAGYPSFVGAPAQAAEPELPSRQPVDDAPLEEMAARVVTNYVERQPSNLTADLAADTFVSLPPEPLRVREVEEIAWADGPESGAVLVTVEASEPDGGGAYVLTYELGVDYRQGRPVATFIETVPTAT